MNNDHGNAVDRREMLRVKLKSLAAEAKIIRKEELRMIHAANPAKVAYQRGMGGARRLKDPDAFKQAAARARLARNAARAKMRRPAEAGVLREELHRHRVVELRPAARAAHIAYGLIRGRSLERIETAPKRPPNWGEIERLVKKYGSITNPILFASPGVIAIPDPQHSREHLQARTETPVGQPAS